jgi:hypothetical protein
MPLVSVDMMNEAQRRLASPKRREIRKAILYVNHDIGLRKPGHANGGRAQILHVRAPSVDGLVVMVGHRPAAHEGYMVTTGRKAFEETIN